MSVISRNPFDLLGDGGESGAAPAPAAKAPAPKAAAAPAAPAKEVPGSKAPRGRGGAEAGRGSRGGYYSRGGPRNVLKTDGAAPAGETVDPESGYEGERRAPARGERGQSGPRGHGEGRGRGRATRTRGGRGGAAGGEGRPVGDRRADHRRSAHALPDSEKKVASGWGADEGNAELEAEVEGAKDATEEAAAPGTPAPEANTEAADAAAPAPRREEEEEDNTKSYEEYLAERAQAALDLGLSKLEGRKVEGTDDFVGSALKKADEEEWYSGANKKESKSSADKNKTKKEKVFLEFEGRFPPPATGERRGGRGGDRGRGAPRNTGDRPGRGGPRGGRGGRAAGAAVPDESAFPALGA